MSTPRAKSVWGWLGRQVGYVKRAVESDPAAGPKTVYRENRVEEKQIPDQPGVTLRRTVIDEVIIADPKLNQNARKIEK